MINETFSNIGSTAARACRQILIFGMGLGLGACPLTLSAQSVRLAWVPSLDASVVGYMVAYGNDGINFGTTMDAGTNTALTVTGLQPGATYYFEVMAYDADSDESPPSNELEYFMPGTPVVTNNVSTNSIQNDSQTNGLNSVVGTTLVTNADNDFALLVGGDGTIAPSRDAKMYQTGKKYTLIATAGKGSVFANWVSNGVVVAVSTKYSFVVEPNVMLQANFITNPFIPIVGTYHGLFYATNGAAEESSGSFSATVTEGGSFSARLHLGAQTYLYSGEFSLAGGTSKTIPRPGLSPITVQLQLGSSNGPMTGTVSDGNWTANLVADPSAYSRTNSAPQAGKYTLLIQGGGNSSDQLSGQTSEQPGGNGFGAVSVDALGNVTFSGVLGDGTPVNSTSVVSRDGQWPFYISLYGGKGSILGWLSFNNGGAISGQTLWIKPPEAAAKLYPGGFTNSGEVIGSVYHYTNGLPVLGFTEGQVVLSNGDVSQSITNQIVLGSGNQAANLTLQTSSGLFKGRVMNPETGALIVIKGIILQNQGIGAGLFLGTNESGSVLLSSAQ